MFQNIKTDIIYYNTNTDFELEFNLCGCCRMRLLNDKCSDRKSLLHSLARAVSRSKVIMVVAPLFSKENVTELVAQAIGTEVCIADNSEYGIASDDAISIIKGSTPLVTPDGMFGGCIIESGPQTLIVLTENKSIRKNIMKTLIHPYIEELYSLESNEDSKVTEELNQETEELNQEIEETEITEETDNEPQIIVDEIEEDEPQTIIEEDISFDEPIFLDEEENKLEIPEESDDDFDKLFIEPEKSKHRSVKRFFEEYNYSQDDEYDGLEDDDLNEISGNNFSIWLLIISIILLLTLAILCYCIFIVPSQAGVSPVSYLQEIYNTMFK